MTAAAIRDLQRALLTVCIGHLPDVLEAVHLYQRLDQVIAAALMGWSPAIEDYRPASTGVALSVEPVPEPPLEIDDTEIDDTPRPPAEPRQQPPKAKRADGPAAPINAELRPWLVTDDEKLRAWRAEGKKWTEIAQRLSRSPAACSVRFAKLGARANNPPKRRCLSCAKLFRSDGPGNRLCSSCNDRSAGLGA